MEVSQTKDLLENCRRALYSERQKRPKPHRDDKILTAWNGEVLSSFVVNYIHLCVINRFFHLLIQAGSSLCLLV